VTAAALLVGTVSLLGGAASAVWQAREARAQRDLAEQAHREAERVSEFVFELFDDGGRGGPGQSVTARELVDRGLRRIEHMRDEPAAQAALLGALGRVLNGLASYDEAQRVTERALGVMQSAGDSLGAARMYYQLGLVLRARGEHHASQDALLRALTIQRRTLGAAHPDLGPTYHDLARVSVYLGDMQEAQRRIDEAYEIQRASLGETHRATLNSRLLAGVVQRRRGQLAESERTIRAVLALRPQSEGSTRTEALHDQLQLAGVLVAVDPGSAEAERIFRSVIESTSWRNPDDYSARVWAKDGLAGMLTARGEYDAALELAREVHLQRIAVHGPDHPLAAPGVIAEILVRAGRYAEAEPLHMQAAEVVRRALGERHPNYLGRLAILAELQMHLGRPARADSMMADVLVRRGDRDPAAAPALPDLYVSHARVQASLGHRDSAQALLTAALEIAGPREMNAIVQRIHETWAELYRGWGEPEQAARHAAVARRH
jgi:tetratricopeptide (TPR) repeat protein